MEEVGTQLAPPLYMYNSIGAAGRFPDAHPMAKKRSLPFQDTNCMQQQHQQYFQRLIPNLDEFRNSWNPKNWDWDSSRLVAKPLDMMEISREHEKQQHQSAINTVNPDVSKKTPVSQAEEDSRLLLKLGGGGGLVSGEEAVTRPSKRVRSGSPGGGGGNYPMCQVDNCKEDLSAAKDYHRRHKVCEVHSKAGNALVGKQMQRFCQQCSRFHPLSEFDEGKRSCRRRLAGHNRRRRKTQPEDVASHLLLSGNENKNSNGDVDIVNLLTVLARAQGNTEDTTRSSSPLPNKDQLMQIINKINSLPIPPVPGNVTNVDKDKPSSESQKVNRKTGSSTMDFLGVLSGTESLSQKGNHRVETDKPMALKPVAEVLSGGERSSTSFQSRGEDSDCQVLDTPVNLQLQLFSSSPENDSPPKLASSRKYFSSDSSNPTEEHSPSCSPPIVQRFFPPKSSRGRLKPESLSTSGEVIANVKASGGGHGGGTTMSLELFGPNGGTDNISIQSSPYRAGYTSSSGSDQSPSSLNSDPQDRTGRILFKLFDKDPSHLPGSLRTQVYNWLSQSPSEMEGYIRPGCVVLTIYLSMPSSSWDQLEGDFVRYISSLLRDSGDDFWGTGRFLAHTEKQIASHKDGKVYLFKSLKAWSSPQLISVSPLAVVAGKETSLILRGRNLRTPGTKIYCTHADGCTLEEATKSADLESTYEEISTRSFKVSAPSTLGRCFIEIENGLRGTSFPIIIADATLCQELRHLEAEFTDSQTKSMKESLHFLNELGWLFQKKEGSSPYSLTRFKFLLVFSVERDFVALVKTLLGILLHKSSGVTADESSLEMLSGINLLNRAVKRRCKNMVDLLIHYSMLDSQTTSRKYVFPPNLAGPGGITPLHLAACTSDSDDLVDVLTNDPQQIGLLSWNSSLDANGLSPFAYASMRNNNSYNTLVASKLTDRIANQISVRIPNEIELQTRTHDHQELSFRIRDHPEPKTCSRCAHVAANFPKRVPGSQGLLHRPYIHSMLAIAAVCVCVCLFLRGAPDIGLVAPFKWENLNFGSM
ncbi:putative transcription factor SBP family [Helianthus annuus]|uniref:Putative squamosa promoter binding protein-like 14 n=1 Tax=Helianthus annuus TaxID=4232 RepID=A0A251RZD5_HELAN|nr:squamosa promoter-binding-like protein 14 [Helianthus annuus]KAF5760015.1 putative transcription factor SBP family [Helianthus annuus]KAJ0438129.1 putative transcription factor SBP family [Helianthus annuus]KAJ0460453.1 putative transcription factor SBP family [Helianthus annuus]